MVAHAYVVAATTPIVYLNTEAKMSEIKDFFTSLGLSPTWAVIIAILAFCLLNYDKVKLLYTDICCWIAQKIGW